MKANLLTSSCALVAAAFLAIWSAPTLATQPAAQPAALRHRDLIIALHNLPNLYSCDDLWYKFRDVLLALGASPDIKILVYQCGKYAGDLAHSPRVHLRFSTPELLTQSQAHWADLKAAPQSIRLSPGQPPSLRESDCALLRQLKNELLPEISNRITSFDLACETLQPSHRPFNITVQTVIPVNSNPRVATRAGTSPKQVR